MATGIGWLLRGLYCAWCILREVLWFAFVVLKALLFGLAAAFDTFWDTILESLFARGPKVTAEDIERLRRTFYANAAREMKGGRVADFPYGGRSRHLPRSA